MSSTLSPLATYQILRFTEQDCRRRSKRLRNAVRLPQLLQLARNVSPKWGHVCELNFAGYAPRSLDGLRMPELRLYLKDALDCGDLRFVFGQGNSMVFNDDFPPHLVSKIVEAFLLLREEPSALDITVNFSVPPPKTGTWGGFQFTGRGRITTPREPALKGLVDAWPDVYASHLPCASARCSPTPGSSQDRLAEKFHVSSKHFDTKLTVELKFALGAPDKHADADFPVRPAKARKTEKTDIRQVRIYLADEISGHVRGETTRKSKTALLIPDFASDVYGFLDRVHIGMSLVANSGLSELIPKLNNRLSKHHLMCEFEGEKMKTGDAVTGAYQLILHHFRRDLNYTDKRVLKLPCADGPAADCGLILHYLSNSHVADLKTPYSDGRFSLKMLAALVMDHNFTIDSLRMRAVDGQLTEYRSMDVVLGGGLRLNALSLAISSQSLASLIKTTDFLRLPTVQGLTELKFLELNPTVGRQQRRKPWTRRQQAILGSPLWLTGIHLLRNCALYEVHCDDPKSHLESIALKLVEFCERFERVENMKIRERFKFKAPRDVNFPFNYRNQVCGFNSIGCGGPGAGRRLLTLYHFRNAATGKWLSAIVGHKSSNGSVVSILHITKGKASPEAMRSIYF